MMEAGNIKLNPQAALGFLTVLDHPQHGLFGGFLVLNPSGRPLEFHCTAPIRPNRAQQILYGPTLEAFLYGEQIGATLIAHAKIEPLVVCTDRESVLAVRELVTMPVALVLPTDLPAGDPAAAEGPSPPGSQILRVDAAHAAGVRLLTFELGRNRLAVSRAAADDRQRIADRLAETAELLDLAEPFTRIREAIEEAQQAAR
jgi:hypothetical protein